MRAERTLLRLHKEWSEAEGRAAKSAVLDDWEAWASRVKRKRKNEPTAPAFIRAEKVLAKVAALREKTRKEEKNERTA